MRSIVVALTLAMLAPSPALAQIGVGMALPGVRIGINVPVYPALVPISGYPVYYAPALGINFFFYDGLYWVYQGDSWYVSSWYDGPWTLVAPVAVPLFVLRIPLRYYVNPPVYFRGYPLDAPPRWGLHWGPEWERHRRGWDRWDRRDVPPPAPLPLYQQRYYGDRYPGIREQEQIRQRDYRYQPHDAVGREIYRGRATQPAPQAPLRVPNAPQHPAPAAAPHPPVRVAPPMRPPQASPPPVSPRPAEPRAPLRVPAPAPAPVPPYPGAAPLRQGPPPGRGQQAPGTGERGPRDGRGGPQSERQRTDRSALAPADRALDRDR